jgi:hypothetical protein
LSRTEARTWYVAYGSNLAAARFACYLAGGCPDGALRTYSGCRDTSGPTSDLPLTLPGDLLFAGHSTVWSGGMAFYETDGAGSVAARAYLLTAEQANDVVVQETRHPIGTDLAISELDEESAAAVREGGYDTVLRLRDIHGLPAVTITARRPLDPESPSAEYLRWVCAGVRETHGWPAERIGRYLMRCRGIRGGWTMDTLVELARGV